MNRARRLIPFYLIPISGASRAEAHASEQGFVLLLPTELYSGAGVVTVLLTLLVLGFVGQRRTGLAFSTIGLPAPGLKAVAVAGRLMALAILLLLLMAGIFGPRDPLSNPLPLMVWTVFWIGIVSVQGLVGDVWRFVNPFAGILWLLRRGGYTPKIRLPGRIGIWPALAGFLVFAGILLADPAPADPGRLARLLAVYTGLHSVMLSLFGARWLVRGEVFTVLMRIYGRVGLLARKAAKLNLGLWGWQISSSAAVPVGAALFCIVLLAVGSFDGLNETFWWLSVLGINPLEFPGRSAVMWQNLAGLIVAIVMLLVVFTVTLALGRRLAGQGASFPEVFCRFAPTLLPIALGYHIAHYLPSFLVDSQYALVALLDPFLNGSDWLGLGEFYVSTGFFNSKASVRVIYLAQAGAVVLGHIIAILTAHSVATVMYQKRRAILLSQLPLAGFMLFYTWFGLWLLASPRF